MKQNIASLYEYKLQKGAQLFCDRISYWFWDTKLQPRVSSYKDSILLGISIQPIGDRNTYAGIEENRFFS